MSFVMTEVNTEDDDNFELRVADYYKHFPREEHGDADVDGSVLPGEEFDDGKRVWL